MFSESLIPVLIQFLLIFFLFYFFFHTSLIQFKTCVVLVTSNYQSPGRSPCNGVSSVVLLAKKRSAFQAEFINYMITGELAPWFRSVTKLHYEVLPKFNSRDFMFQL